MAMDERCPRKLKNLPCSSCPLGRAAVDAQRKGKSGGCAWFVADPESHYCFFKLMQDDGNALSTHRIARLLMIDDNEVKRTIQSFRRKVNILFNVHSLEEFFDS